MSLKTKQILLYSNSCFRTFLLLTSNTTKQRICKQGGAFRQAFVLKVYRKSYSENMYLTLVPLRLPGAT